MGKLILNGIEYIGGEADNVFAPVIYSDVERVIGVWRDNKPLYAKTYTASITSGTQWIDTGLDSGDLIVKSEGTLEQNNGQILTLASGDTGAGAGINTFIVGIVTPSKWSCLFRTNSNDARGNLTLTLYYTKGSDVAGSGDYNTYGVPTVHYSTSEQVIGTWLGKPLYQKVFTGLSVVLGSDWVNAIDISSMDMENCILGIGIVSNTYQTPLCTRINGNYLQAYMNGMGGVTITTIVIQYTKTTDT